jgi:hypothetical protein
MGIEVAKSNAQQQTATATTESAKTRAAAGISSRRQSAQLLSFVQSLKRREAVKGSSMAVG